MEELQGMSPSVNQSVSQVAVWVGGWVGGLQGRGWGWVTKVSQLVHKSLECCPCQDSRLRHHTLDPGLSLSPLLSLALIMSLFQSQNGFSVKIYQETGKSHISDRVSFWRCISVWVKKERLGAHQRSRRGQLAGSMLLASSQSLSCSFSLSPLFSSSSSCPLYQQMRKCERYQLRCTFQYSKVLITCCNLLINDKTCSKTLETDCCVVWGAQLPLFELSLSSLSTDSGSSWVSSFTLALRFSFLRFGGIRGLLAFSFCTLCSGSASVLPSSPSSSSAFSPSLFSSVSLIFPCCFFFLLSLFFRVLSYNKQGFSVDIFQQWKLMCISRCTKTSRLLYYK